MSYGFLFTFRLASFVQYKIQYQNINIEWVEWERNDKREASIFFFRWNIYLLFLSVIGQMDYNVGLDLSNRFNTEMQPIRRDIYLDFGFLLNIFFLLFVEKFIWERSFSKHHKKTVVFCQSTKYKVFHIFDLKKNRLFFQEYCFNIALDCYRVL